MHPLQETYKFVEKRRDVRCCGGYFDPEGSVRSKCTSGERAATRESKGNNNHPLACEYGIWAAMLDSDSKPHSEIRGLGTSQIFELTDLYLHWNNTNKVVIMYLHGWLTEFTPVGGAAIA